RGGMGEGGSREHAARLRCSGATVLHLGAARPTLAWRERVRVDPAPSPNSPRVRRRTSVSPGVRQSDTNCAFVSFTLFEFRVVPFAPSLWPGFAFVFPACESCPVDVGFASLRTLGTSVWACV